MEPLDNVLRELRLVVIARLQQSENDWLFLIAKPTFNPFPPAPEQCYALYSKRPDNPDIYEEEAEAIRRHFKLPPTGLTAKLGL
jgi:hypothetical protein